MLTHNLKQRLENETREKYEDFTQELHTKRIDYCKINSTKMNEEKYVCNICSKMFKAPNFVHNHIFNKHMAMIQDNVDKNVQLNIKYLLNKLVL
jgi:hypothetical protein